jgi:hypothetical protein
MRDAFILNTFVGLVRRCEILMQPARSVLSPATSAAADPDRPAQTLDEADIALTVASTLEPSCAFAFCFGYDFGRRRSRVISEMSAVEDNRSMKGFWSRIFC